MARKKPLVGVTVAQYKGLMPSYFISGLKHLGIDFFEINRSVFADLENVANVIGNAVTAFHLPLIFEDAWDFSCPAFQPQIDETITTINKIIKPLNIQHVICHPPEPGESKAEIEMDEALLFRNLQKLHLPVYLENVLTVSNNEFEQFYQHAQTALGEQLAGMCFDAPHSFITGHDPLTHFNNLKERVGCVHLSDCLQNEDIHIPFNSGGCLPVEPFLNELRQHKFDGFITLEIQPKSMQEIMPYIDSYLTTLKYVHPLKHKTALAKIRLLKPMLTKFTHHHTN